MRISAFVFPICGLAFALLLRSAPLSARDSIEKVADRVEDRAKDFSERFDKELDKLVIDGFREEDELEELAKKLRPRLDEVHDEIKDDDDREGRKEFEQTLALAGEMNEAMAEYAFSPALREIWGELRADLNRLANHYGLVTIVVMQPRR